MTPENCMRNGLNASGVSHFYPLQTPDPDRKFNATVHVSFT